MSTIKDKVRSTVEAGVANQSHGLAGYKNFRMRKFLGANSLESESSRERKFPGKITLHSDCSREQKFQGANWLGTRVLLELSLQGVN